ncbi:hypothetical protein HON59_01245 [bacterium]|nr:hypothetical protein [bacterium]MBT3729976.1 hypothetical protein [bacterium]MBT4894674.1 hypothetical protein [bacterium]
MIKKSTDEKIDELSQMMKKGFEGSDRKINNLAEAMAKGFSNAEKRTDEKIDDLARMVAKGFENTATKDDMREVKKDIKEINMKLHDIDDSVRKHSTRIEKLEEASIV